MSFDAMDWVIAQDLRPSSLKFTLYCLAYVTHDETGLAYASNQYIADYTSQDRKTVISNVAELVRRGYLTDTGRRTGKTRQIPVYFFNSPKFGTLRESQERDASGSGKDSQNRDPSSLPNSGRLKTPKFPAKDSQISRERLPTLGHVSGIGSGSDLKNPPPPPTKGGHTGKRARPPKPESAGFLELKAIYPRRAGSHRYDDANRQYELRLAEGIEHATIRAGIERYAKLMAATGEVGTKHVMQMATFLGPNKCFLEEHALPSVQAVETPKQRADRERKDQVTAIWREGKVKGVDFRVIFGHESIDDYRAAMLEAVRHHERHQRGETSARPLELSKTLRAMGD